MNDMMYIVTSKEEHDKIYKKELKNYKKNNCGEEEQCKGCNIYISMDPKKDDTLKEERNYKISSSKKMNKKCKMLCGIRRFRIIILKT